MISSKKHLLEDETDKYYYIMPKTPGSLGSDKSE